ncbi:MAG: ROK family protein, partial [Actinomycetota bacterium]
VVAGIDLGGTKIQTIVVRGAEILGQARVPTPGNGAEGISSAILETVHVALDASGAGESSLRSVGIGAPGRARDGIVSHSPNVVGMQEPFPLGPRVSAGLGGVPVHVDNDVTVATLGELERGAGRPFGSLLGVFVGTGVGGGLVIDRTVWRGRGAAAEIGHTIVKPDGRLCGCGGRGHLEAYAGRSSMQAKTERLVAHGEHTVVLDLMARHGRDRMTSGIIERALAQGDSMTERLMEQAVWALGVALASAQNLLDVEAIIVGGGLAERFGHPFVDRIAAQMRPLLFSPDPPAVLPAELGDLSGAMGAIVLAGG